MTSPRTMLLSAALLLIAAGLLPARTITLTADDCDKMAVISAKAPRLGWAPMQMSPGVYTTYNQIHLFHDGAILLRFPLNKIPKKQRITKAEFTIPVTYRAGVKQHLQVHRLLPEWGTGTCWQYRLCYPKKVEWAEPGARGVTSDRANKLSAVFKIANVGEATVDVTQDIELWYTGAVANRGWVLSLDDPGSILYVGNCYPAGTGWKLQITFEPE
jgi:hypothetical protein